MSTKRRITNFELTPNTVIAARSQIAKYQEAIFLFWYEIQTISYCFRFRIPLTTYIQLAFYTVATMGLSNSSVGYLNYPTQVILKCCKLIPVLIGGILIQGLLLFILHFSLLLLVIQ